LLVRRLKRPEPGLLMRFWQNGKLGRHFGLLWCSG
jgi:hypothetical protein